VLVVDDKPNYLSLFRRIVGPEMDLSTASDAAEALATLRAQEIDVVVTDVRMPGTDGLELLRRIKAEHPEIEVVVMTAYGAITEAVTAMKSGATDYLTKPFDPDAAAEAIRAAVGRREARALERQCASQPSTASASADPEMGAGPPSGSAELAKLPYREALAHSRDRISKEYLTQLLTDVRGNVTHAADRAGIERESLHRLLKKYGLKADDFRTK